MKRTVIDLCLLGIIILLLGLFVFNKCKKPKEPGAILPKYFPVVIKVPKYIEKPVPYKIVIPPHIEYQYMSYEDSMYLINRIDSLKGIITIVSKDPKHPDTVRITTKFLTSYPTQPKLINFDLQMDSLWITTLDIGANLITRQYPLALLGYEYRYDGHDMSVKELKTPYGMPKKSKWHFETFLSLGSDFISYPAIIPYITLGGEMSYSRIKFVLEPKVTINKSPELGIDVKLGYKLWQWPK
jgi:hypothetical protein